MTYGLRCHLNKINKLLALRVFQFGRAQQIKLLDVIIVNVFTYFPFKVVSLRSKIYDDVLLKKCMESKR